MSGVDNRIVSMTFDNGAFERNLSNTLISLDKLRQSLDFANSTRGMNDLTNAAKSVDLSSIASSVDNISNKFSLLGAIGFSAIQHITSGILDFVKNTAGDILGPIITGGKERALNIEQAKFMFRGLGIDVDQGMKSALDAVLGTAYGLDEAAKAAAQFGASGIKVGTEMTNALRGVAGSAALTGKSFTEMADIFAGSAGSGKVTNQDLMQFATRGLNAAAAVGKVMGKTEAQIHEMATAGTLDFKTFADAMNTAFGEHATKANETYAGSLANLHAAMSRLGASFFTDRLVQQRDIFNALTPVIDNVTKSMKPLFDVFNKFGRLGTDKLVAFLKGLNFDNFTKGMVNVADSVGHLFTFVGQLVGFLKSAFRDIFPPATISIFVSLSDLFENFTSKLVVGGSAAEKIKDIFRGLFSILEIGWTIIKEVFFLFANLFGNMSGAGDGVLSFAAKIGVMLQGLDKVLVTGGGIHKFFVTLGDVIQNPTKYLKELTIRISDFFNSFSGSDALTSTFDRLGTRFETLSNLAGKLKEIFANLSLSDGVKKVFEDIWTYIKDWFSSLGAKIAAAFKPGDFNSALDILNVGLLGGIALMLERFMNGGLLKFATGSNVFDKIGGILDGLRNQLKTMQAEIKAEILMKIAAAIAILAASVLVLSLIDSEALTKALTAMAVGFGELVSAMALLTTIASGPKGAATLDLVVAAMIGLAGAMVIMSAAIKILSTLNVTELAKGLAGVGVGLALMVAAVTVLPTNPAGMLASSLAMTTIANALIFLAIAVKMFAQLSWGELAKGLAGVAGGLAIITLAMNLMPIGPTIAAGLAMIPLALGLTVLAGAVKLFSLLSWGELLKGMVGIAASLLILAGAMNLMPPTLPLTAAGLILVGIALNSVALAVRSMGSMDFGTLAKGIGSIAVMLALLAVGLNVMNTTVAGSAALLVASGALLILARVMKELGALSIGQIVTSLLSIAATFVILGVSAALLTPVIPSLLALGVALGLIGAGAALFGVGAILVATAFELMAKAGVAGITALIASIKLFITALPEFASAFVLSLVQMSEELIKAAPLLVRLLTALLLQLLETVITLSPKIGEAFGVLLSTCLQIMRDKFPEFVTTGFQMLIALLSGVRDNIVEVTNLAVDIVVNFATTLTNNVNKLTDAAITLLVAFLTAISDRIGDVVASGLNVLVNLLLGISDNIGRVVDSAGDIITTFITEVGNNATRIATAGADALADFIRGIGDGIITVTNAAVDVVIAFVNAIGNDALRIANAAADMLISFLNGLANAINEKSGELQDAGLRVAGAIIDGMTFGFASRAGEVAGKAIDVARRAVNAVTDFLGISSPSKVFRSIGQNMLAGMTQAFDNDSSVKRSVIQHVEEMVNSVEETLNRIPDIINDMTDLNPTITPILDLTKVQSDSKTLNQLMAKSSISQATSISSGMSDPNIQGTWQKELNAAGQTENIYYPPGWVGTKQPDISFEQNIYAPTAPSTNDIYRQTRSQIMLAKKELGVL